jgi:hypothetical protein
MMSRVLFHRLVLICLPSTEGANITRVPRRMGISDCAAHLHHIRIFYTDVQDWPVADRYMG